MCSICLKKNLMPIDSRTRLLSGFNSGKYRPELLFQDEEILQRIASHPMAL